MGDVIYTFLPDALVFMNPISGGMGEGMGMGMGGNIGMGMSNPPDPPPPPPSPPPSPPPPAQEPHLIAAAPSAKAGSMWVEGSTLTYVATNGFQYAETGASQGSPAGAVPGSIWIHSNGEIDYIDASGVQRRASVQNLGAIGSPAVIGSMFLNDALSPFAQVNWTVVGGPGSILFAWWNGF